MASELEEFLQGIVDLSDEEKTAFARDCLANMIALLKYNDASEEDCVRLIFGVTKLFVSADRKCSQAEYDFFKNVTGFNITPDEFFEATNYGTDEEFKNALYELLRGTNYEFRKNACMFGATVISCDDVITKEETQLFIEVMATTN